MEIQVVRRSHGQNNVFYLTMKRRPLTRKRLNSGETAIRRSGTGAGRGRLLHYCMRGRERRYPPYSCLSPSLPSRLKSSEAIGCQSRSGAEAWPLRQEWEAAARRWLQASPRSPSMQNHPYHPLVAAALLTYFSPFYPIGVLLKASCHNRERDATVGIQ